MNLANKITVARICMIPLFMLAFQHYPFWMVEQLEFLHYINQYGLYGAIAIFVIASATDKLDGYIARKNN